MDASVRAARRRAGVAQLTAAAYVTATTCRRHPRRDPATGSPPRRIEGRARVPVDKRA